MERAVQIYYMIPDLVKIIITQSEDAYACFANKNCILSDQNPDGIPAWKIFSFNFWTGPDSPLGRQWTLSPEDVSRCTSWTLSMFIFVFSVQFGRIPTKRLPWLQRGTFMSVATIRSAHRPRKACIRHDRNVVFFGRPGTGMASPLL